MSRETSLSQQEAVSRCSSCGQQLAEAALAATLPAPIADQSADRVATQSRYENDVQAAPAGDDITTEEVDFFHEAREEYMRVAIADITDPHLLKDAREALGADFDATTRRVHWALRPRR